MSEIFQELILDNLNDPQKKAVKHKDGPILVFAGAGSGKTRVITSRIAYLIGHHKVESSNILGVTFTKKAAEEMKTRVSTILSELQKADSLKFSNKLPTIGTFHSIGSLILRRDGNSVGLDRNFSILDADDSIKMIKEIMLEQNIDNKQTKPKSVSWAIQGAKNDLINPVKYKQYASTFFEDIVADIYVDYQRRLKEINAVDFGDLLFLTVKLFGDNEEILNKYREKYKYLLIDEYQDTNEVQYSLSRMLTGKNENICVVGDDDQGIYKWRGADIKNIINFQKDFNDVEVVKLEQNYRSVGNIIKAAGSVIHKNSDRVNKKIWTANDEGEDIVLYQARDAEDEADFLVHQISRLRQDYHEYKDFAVLYRTNAQSRVIEEAFLKRGVPYKLVGGFRFYDRREIKDILAYLKFINNPKDVLSLLRVINEPSRKIGPKSVDQINRLAKKLDIGMGELLLAVYWKQQSDLPIKGFPEEVLKDLDEVVADNLDRGSYQKAIKVFGSLYFENEDKNVDKVIDDILEKSKYIEAFNDDSDEASARIDNIKELINVASQYDTVTKFLEGVALMEDTDEVDEDTNRVHLMTLHSSKGLEFPVIFMVGMEEGLLPHSRSMSDQEDLEEERRLCYVGITRAKKRLFFSFAQGRSKRGEEWASTPSRFLGELPQEICDYYSWQ